MNSHQKAKRHTGGNRRRFKNLKKTHSLTLLFLNPPGMSSKSVCCSEGRTI